MTLRLPTAFVLALLLTANALAEGSVVFLGEQHTSETDHEAQLAALRELHASGPVLIVAEMFTERAETDLGEWNQLSSPTSFAAPLWEREWGHPQELYSPIFGWAQEQGVDVVWLRPDPDVTKQVRQQGPAVALTKIDEVLIGPKSYREFMANIAREHAHGSTSEMDQAMVDRMFVVQCFWDEFMAWRLAQLSKIYPNATLAVLIGDGHLRPGEGIPWRLARRAPSLQQEVRRATGR